MSRRDIRAQRREKRRPITQQRPDYERDAALDDAFAQLAREQAQQQRKDLKP